MALLLEPICPLCGERLLINPEKSICSKGHIYPVLLDIILDLSSTQEYLFDHENPEMIANLISMFDKISYHELYEIEFRGSNSVPEKLLHHYRNYYSTAIERNQRMTHIFRRQATDHFINNGTDAALEIGCGRGGNLVILSKMYRYVVGIDPCLSNLILAKKLLEEKRVSNVLLIRGYGQKVPYPSFSFDYVTAINVLEHVIDIDTIVKEIYRIMCTGGIFVADSRNRYDIFFPEPHVKVRFVGFLPRHWAKKYVHWRTGTVYDQKSLLSYFDLNRVLKKYFGKKYKILCVRVSAYGYSELIDTLVFMLSRIPILSKIILLIFPSHVIISQK